jgi:hypothetical protein
VPSGAACKKATQGCLCGFNGSSVRQCRCSPLQIENYLGKISGPLLDRIAIHVSVRPVDVEAWSGVDGATRMTSAAMREMVARAREIQARRFADTNGVDCNAHPEGCLRHTARWNQARRRYSCARRNRCLYPQGHVGTSYASRARLRTWREASESRSDTSRKQRDIGREIHGRITVSPAVTQYG